MPVEKPSDETIEALAAAHHFTMSSEELHAYQASIEESLSAFERLDLLAEPKLPVRYRRTAGHAPDRTANPYGAWAWRCSIRGADEGPLHGKRVALKDVVAVAGIPLRNGSSVMEGFVSDVDATVVTRILDAGGEIIGKATCESFSYSGGSNTSEPDPVRNPRKPTHMAGGSSSGSAALLAAGDCDLAIGGDQGGSIRQPASWCGIVGLKPTFGLVPYTGVCSGEPTLDHIGPMARTSSEIAVCLDVIAGPDGIDQRQCNVPTRSESYQTALLRDCRGLRIGIVAEGFEWPTSEVDVDRAVRNAAAALGELGAEVSSLSIPMHRDGVAIFAGLAEGAWATMIRDDGIGRGSLGYYDSHLRDFFADARRRRANQLPHTLKVGILLGSYLSERYRGSYYARAQNLRRSLRDAYDAAFRDVDLLVMPTTPQKAIALDQSRDLKDELLVTRSASANTCAFNLTGHPALSLPVGSSDGLPIGMMLVGRHWDESNILRAANSYEIAATG